LLPGAATGSVDADTRRNPMTAQPSTSAPLVGARSGAFVAAKVLTALFVLGVLVNVFLAGLGTFGRGEGTGFGPHRMLGEALLVAALLILILVAVARPGGRALRLAGILAVLMLVQYGLGDAGEKLPVLGGLHALNALVVAGVSFGLAASTGALRKPH
jgi:hypothetical protein